MKALNSLVFLLSLMSLRAMASFKMEMSLVHKKGLDNKEVFLKNEFYQSKVFENIDEAKLKISDFSVNLNTQYKNRVGEFGPVSIVEVQASVFKTENEEKVLLKEFTKELKMNEKEVLSLFDEDLGYLDISLRPKN